MNNSTSTNRTNSTNTTRASGTSSSSAVTEVDPRVATLILFSLCCYVIVDQLRMNVLKAWKGLYNKVRTSMLISALIHSVTGFIFTIQLMLGYRMRTYKSSLAVLIISCVFTTVYQVLMMYMMVLKLDVVSFAGNKTAVRLGTRIFVVLRGLLSIASFILFLDVSLDEQISASPQYRPLRDISEVMNTSANIMYIVFILGCQLFFLYSITKTRSSVVSTNMPQSSQQPQVTSSVEHPRRGSITDGGRSPSKKKTPSVLESLASRNKSDKFGVNKTELAYISVAATVGVVVMALGIGTIKHSFGIASVTLLTCMMSRVYSAQDTQITKAKATDNRTTRAGVKSAVFSRVQKNPGSSIHEESDDIQSQ